jgi:glycosyltransferase involved in cell wall biosynthesis
MSSARVTIGIPTYNRSAFLSEAIESVLAQSYGNFRLVISDNASTDQTAAVVGSFADPRIEYIRANQNIGMIPNFNRLIYLADTEFLMLLPDDDLLYPDYLSSVVDVLDRFPTVGVVHSAFDEIDFKARVRKSAVSFVNTRKPPTLESGRAYLERSMASIALCFSTATYRRLAIREAGGMKSRDEPFADVPLFMRIALKWDFAYIDRSLVGFRQHGETETKQLVSSGDREADNRDRLLTYGQVFFDRRIGFLDQVGLPSPETNRYRSLATLRFLADRAGLGSPWVETTIGFFQIVRLYPRILLHPMAWRFMAAQSGGRKLRRAAKPLARTAVKFRGHFLSMMR